MNADPMTDMGLSLKDEIIEYNWQYRKKICSKCRGTPVS